MESGPVRGSSYVAPSTGVTANLVSVQLSAKVWEGRMVDFASGNIKLVVEVTITFGVLRECHVTVLIYFCCWYGDFPVR